MLVLGIAFAGAAVGFTALIVAYNLDGGPTVTPQILGLELPPVNALQVFIAGLALAFVFWLGVRMARVGMRRGRRMRSRLRQLEGERAREPEVDERRHSPVAVD